MASLSSKVKTYLANNGVNDVDFMVERAEECIEDHGKRPTFIAVDWWEDGDVVEAARLVNLIEIE